MRELLRSPNSCEKLNAGGITECADVWRHSTLAKELEQIISHSEDSFENSSDVLSPLSDLEDTHEQPIRGLAVGDVNHGENIHQNLQKEQAGSPGLMELSQLQLPEQAPELVDFYFSHIHCWLPILERRDILRVLHSEPYVESTDAALKSCLWAVIMFTLARTKLVPEADQSSERILAALYLHLNARLQEWALEDIQALLIIVLLKIGLGQHQAAWILVGQATRMLLAHDQRPPRYTHTLLGCILLDNFLSALLGKKSYFPPGQPHFEPLDENSLEEWEPWNPPQGWGGDDRATKRGPLRAMSGFNLMSQLMYRLSRLNHGHFNNIDYLEYTTELQTWKARLPVHHQMRTMDTSNPLILNLELMWRFVVSSAVVRLNMEDPMIVQLALENARSTLDIVRAIIRDKDASIPMLLGYLVQAQNSIEAILQAQPLEAGSGLIMELLTLQCDLKRRWAPVDDSTISAVVHGEQCPDWTREAGRPSNSTTDWGGVGKLSIPNPSGLYHGGPGNSIAPWTQATDMSMMSRGHHQPRAGNSPQWSINLEPNPFSERLDLSGVAQSSHSNDFDALLEGMSSFVPPKRYVNLHYSC